MLGLGMQEVFIILVIALIIFGARRLPELGRSLGKGITEFKRGLKGLEDDVDSSGNAPRSEPVGELPRPPQRVTTPAPRFESSPADKTSPPQ